MQAFGNVVRKKRMKLFEENRSFSLRQVSRRIGVEPSYLSKIERGLPVKLSEEKIVALALELGLDPDYLLALGGKISEDVQRIIKKRPRLFARIVREMQRMPTAVIEERAYFRNMAATMNRLHDMAAIGAFQLSEDGGASFWTEQVPKLLGLPEDTRPSILAVVGALDTQSSELIRREAARGLSRGTSFQCEVRTRKNPSATLRLWGLAEHVDNGLNRLGIIQDVTACIRLRDDARSARDELQLQVDAQYGEITAAIRKLNEENRRRHILEINLQVLNRKIARRARNQQRFFKEHAFQLRSLITRLALESADGCDQESMSRIINRILPKIDDLGDFLTGPSELAPMAGDTDVRRLLAELADVFRADIEATGLSLIVSTAPDLPPLLNTDERRLRQMATAVMELFAANTEWGAIQMSAAAAGEPEPRLLLTFAAPSAKHPVDAARFSPVTNGDREPSSKADPVRMVAPLARMLGGELSVSHAPGAGVTVSIAVPIRPFAQNSVPAPTAGEEARSVLVVEDDPLTRLFARRTLERAGYAVTEAHTGADATKLLAARPFDLVMLDIELPDARGEELARAVREDENSPNRDTPMVAVTAHASRKERDQFLASGVDGVVIKPYDMAALIDEAARAERARSRR